MTMSKHTDGAVKAAEKVLLKYDSNSGTTIESVDDWDVAVDGAATIIDQETGLPELKARIKELEMELLTLITFSADLQQRLEAEKAELVEAYEMVQDMLTSHQRMNLAKYEDNKEYRAIKVARALLAKVEPVEGTEDL